MTILSWIFIGCLSTFFIAFCVGIFSFVLFFVSKRDMNTLKKRRPKKKINKKRLMQTKRLLEKKKKKQRARGGILVTLSLLFLGGGFYARYYEMTNLSSTDGNIIVQSYFVTDEVNKNLTNLQNGADVDENKTKLMELSSLLASYGSSTPSNSLSKNGQQTLNRYYVQIRDYGTNLYSLSAGQLNNQETISKYLDDMTRINQSQKKLFKEFSINEVALKQKK